jgi:hypothetical protein
MAGKWFQRVHDHNYVLQEQAEQQRRETDIGPSWDGGLRAQLADDADADSAIRGRKGRERPERKVYISFPPLPHDFYALKPSCFGAFMKRFNDPTSTWQEQPHGVDCNDWLHNDTTRQLKRAAPV